MNVWELGLNNWNFQRAARLSGTDLYLCQYFPQIYNNIATVFRNSAGERGWVGFYDVFFPPGTPFPYGYAVEPD